MTKNKTGEQSCPYNIGVKCNIGACECARCGWYPMEAWRRRADLKQKGCADLKQKGCAAYGQQVEKQV